MKRKFRARPKRRNWILRVAVVLLLAFAVVVLVWCRWVYVQIEKYAGQDQAAPADAIGVFGAAEYDGRPSPVYRARLDHARQGGRVQITIFPGGSRPGCFSVPGISAAWPVYSGTYRS